MFKIIGLFIMLVVIFGGLIWIEGNNIKANKRKMVETYNTGREDGILFMERMAVSNGVAEWVTDYNKNVYFKFKK